MHIAALTIELHIPGCQSLKQKRSRIKPLIIRLHREFNLSAAEIDQQDHHTLSTIACVVVSNSDRHAQRVLTRVPGWIETQRPDLQVIDSQIELW